MTTTHRNWRVVSRSGELHLLTPGGANRGRAILYNTLTKQTSPEQDLQVFFKFGVYEEVRDGPTLAELQAGEPSFDPPAFTHTVPFSLLDADKRIAYGVVIAPDEFDVQGHRMSAEDIEVASHRFMERLQAEDGVRFDEHHDRLVEPEDVRVVESWIQREPVEWIFNNQHAQIAPGSWCLGVKVYSDSIWDKVLAGEITGFSPAGWGVLSPAEDYGGPGSGHHGHKGRPGQRGGSAPGKAGATAPQAANLKESLEGLLKRGTG